MQYAQNSLPYISILACSSIARFGKNTVRIGVQKVPISLCRPGLGGHIPGVAFGERSRAAAFLVKHLKPLKGLIATIEKSQKNLVADLKKTQNLTGDIDKKTADSRAKKLCKKGKIMDGAAKKYISHARSTGKKCAAVLARLAANEFTGDDATAYEEMMEQSRMLADQVNPIVSTMA